MATPVVIQDTMFRAVSAGLAGSGVAWPNVGYKGAPPYYRVFVLPGQTRPYGLARTSIFTGVLQVDCVVKKGVGSIEALRMAEAVMALFPRGSRLDASGLRVEFNKEGWVGPGFQEGDLYWVPVSFEYKAIGDE